MNTQTTIKARRTNNMTTPIGEHMTLTRVINEPLERRIFAWAMRDDGQEVYIPAQLVKREKMTTADEGAGFTAVCAHNPRAVDSQTAPFMASLPLKWDGDAEDVVIDVPDEPDVISREAMDEVEEDLDRLADACDDMVLACANEIREAVKQISAFDIKAGVQALNATADKLEAFRAFIDETVPRDD